MRIGTSGWQYKDWRGTVYPPRLAQRSWLEAYAQRFDTVEVNNSFYRLPDPGTFARWRAETPRGFVFAVKASRYLTHYLRLRDPEEPVARLLEHAEPLRERLGPVLLQLPPNFPIALDRLDRTLGAFPPRVRVAVEVRDDSWLVDELRAVLADRGAAFVLADRDSRWITPRWRTAEWCYVRFHWGRGSPPSAYGRRALQRAAATVRDLWGDDPDGYAYFNNDPHGAAVRDAQTFARLLAPGG